MVAGWRKEVGGRVKVAACSDRRRERIDGLENMLSTAEAGSTQSGLSSFPRTEFGGFPTPFASSIPFLLFFFFFLTFSLPF